MGGKCPHRHVKKRRYSHKTARRTKFLINDILFSISLFLAVFIFYSKDLLSLFVFPGRKSIFFVRFDFVWFLDWGLGTWWYGLWCAEEARWGKEALAYWWRLAWDGPVLLLALRVCFFFLSIFLSFNKYFLVIHNKSAWCSVITTIWRE